MSTSLGSPAATPAIPRGVGTPLTLLVTGLVLLLTLGGTWLAWEGVAAHDAVAIRADFDFRARDVGKRILQRMNAHEQVLLGVAGLFTGSDVVNRTDFHNYVSALRLQEHHPGIQGVGFALLVPASELARHTSAVQREGFTGYAIRPPGPRDPYTSIVFLEPFEGRNLRAFGFDMYSEPVRREAMERSLAEGRAALSGKVMLVQETDADVQAGVLLYLPVFREGTAGSSVGERRERLLGWVYMPFRMNDLVVGVLGERGPELATAIYDGDEPGSAGLLFDSEKANGDRTPALDHLEARQTILVAGRPWTLVVQSLPPFHERLSRHTQPVVAFGGIALSLLLTGLVWVLASGRDRALRLARGMNRDLLESGAALRASEAKYRGLFDSLMDGFVLVGMDGVVRDSNEAYRKMLGYSEDELARRTYMDLTPERWHPVEARVIAEQVLPRGYSDVYEKEYRRKDGTVFPVELRTFLLKEGGRPVAMWAIVRDVTDARAFQAQIALTSRLAALGTLVAGVAHEINNPLAAAISDQDIALGAVRGLRDRLRGSGPIDTKAEVLVLDEVVEELGEAQEAGRRIERIVKDLKVFGRPNQKDARERVRLMDVVDLAMLWLPAAINQTATVTVENGGAPDVVATAGQITQVVVNLVTNAAKATRDGARGAIVIRVAPGTPGMARLDVVDQGSGIEPAVLPHIFEPFFTTGAVGKGTGLGLSICHAIVSSHGGALTVRSEVGKGSTFRVELPAVTEEA